MVAVFALDKHHSCRFLNAVAEVLTGLTTAQARGFAFREIAWRRRTGRFEDSELGKLLAAGSPGTGEESIIGGDGVFRPVSFRVVPLDTGDGTVIVEMVDLSGETGTGRALRESEQRLRLAIEATGIGIWDVDAVDGQRRWSPEFIGILGLPPEQRPDMSLFASMIHPDDRAWVVERYERAFEDPAANPYNAEFRVHRASDGAERWLAVTGQVWFDPDGKPLRGIGTLRDITERRRIEETIREREERLRIAVVAGRMGTWRYSIATGEQQWDDTQYALLGVDPGQKATRALFLSLVHPEDRPKVNFRTRTLPRDAFIDTEFRIVRPDGGIKWVASHALTRFDANGEPIEMIGVNRDVTSEKEAEIALRNSEQRNRLAIEGAGIGTWEIDFVTGERQWSNQYRKLFGLPPDVPADPETTRGLMKAGHWELARDVLIAASDPDGSGHIAFEFDINRADDGEHRSISASGQMFFDEETRKPVRAVGILLDITDRKEVERRQRLALREMNHRVKNSLAVVQAMVSQTVRLTPDPEDAFERIQERVMALSRTNDFLDRFSWDGSILRLLVESEMAPFVDEGGPRRVEMIGPMVRLDTTATLALGIVLHELASNAANHGALSVPGGHVEVTWSVVPGTPLPSVELEWVEKGGPPVPSTRRRGLGARLVDGTVRGSLSGTVRMEYPTEGVRCRIVFPLKRVTEMDGRGLATETASS